MTSNDLAKKLLEEFFLEYAKANENLSNITIEFFATFCAQKIQELQFQVWDLQICVQRTQDHKQDVFNLDKTIVDTVTNQVRVETAKEIKEDFLKWLNSLHGNKKKLNAVDFALYFEKFEARFLGVK